MIIIEIKILNTIVCAFLFSFSSLDAQVVADFAVDKSEGCNTVQSQFTDLSTSSSSSIVKWEWEIGEISSSLQNPGRVFTDIGTYDVCLTVTDAVGNSDVKCIDHLISVYGRPSVDFDVDLNVGCSPLLVNFENNASSPNGAIREWVWGLGGESGVLTTNDENLPISSTYNSDGFYTVTLKVKDEKGCEQSVTKQDIIQIEDKPEIIISTAEPIGCKFPMTVDFENFGSSSNIVYEWDFGNGETFTGFNPDPVTYDNTGDYTVVVRSRFLDSDCFDEVVLKDFISEGGAIEFDFFPKAGCSGLQVQFEDRSALESDLWEWDFGDGQTSNERDPVHRYNTPGSYTIKLYRKTDECEGTKISEFEVLVVEDPVFTASFDNSAGCKLPAPVQLNASGSDENQYFWFVGEPGAYIAELSGKNVNLDIAEYGTYRLSVFARNPQGCVTSMVLDSIRIAPLKVSITGNVDGCVPFVAELDLISNVNSPLNVEFSEFTGEPLVTANANFVDVEVTEEGTYGYNGIFSNELGCQDTLEIPILIRGGPAPMVDFELSELEVCPLEQVNFIDLSSGDIDSWMWEIGDTLSFDSQELNAGFEIPGTYDVSLTISSNGCMETKLLEDYLTIRPPGVNFEVVNNCIDPRTISAINTSSSADSIVWSYVTNSDTTKIVNQDSISITFPSTGSYLLSLSAYDESSGCASSDGQLVVLTQPEAKVEVDLTSGCAPLALNLSDNSKDAVEWEYIPSGASFSNPHGPNSSLVLSFGTTYENIGIVVTDIHGCTDTAYTEPIMVNDLKASFAAPSPVCFDDTLSVMSFSTSTFGTITNLTWILGDGLDTSTIETAEFVGPGVGKFNLKLVVEDDLGCIDSTTLGLGAFFRAPNFELEADTLACSTSEVRFRNVLHAGGYNYLWEFGDGTTSTSINPTHLYGMEGEYLVNVSIEDNQKCINETDLSSIVKVYNPIADFIVDSTFATCPILVSNFTNLSSNAVQYSWNFGDETGLSTTVDPSHLYTIAGLFDVELVAIRSELCTDTLRFDDLIKLDGPNGTISFEVDSSCAPMLVNFEAILEEQYKMVWDFGDGNLFTVSEPTDSATIMHSYLDAGNFIPKIILTNEDDCTIIRSGDNIQANSLSSAFELSDSLFCDQIPQEVRLTSTSESSSPILNYSWSINGSEPLQGESVVINPTEIGFSDIKLVTNSEFCTDSISLDSILRIGNSPMSDLAIDTFVCLGKMVDVDFVPELTSDEFYWFDSSGLFDPSSYLPAGNQFYFLEIENAYGCTTVDSILVNVIDDKTRFAGPDRTICEGNSLAIEIDYGQQIFWPTIPDCTDCDSILLTPDSSTFYEVEVVNDFGCLVRDTFVVEVLNQEDLYAGEDQKICLSDNAILLGFALGDYQWTPSELLSNPSEQITATQIDTSQLFVLTSTKDECTLRDSVFVEIIDKAELETRGDTICFGDTAQIFARGSVDNVTWENDSDLSSLDISNPFVSTELTKTYTVIGELGGCASDTAEVQVFVYPEISGSLPNEKSYFKGISSVELEISNLGQDSYQYLWSPEDIISCASCDKITVQVDGTEQQIQLEVLDPSSGCRILKTVDLRQLENCEGAENTIGVPNIFSPNEDGVNDLLEIEAPAFQDIEFVRIYDRWGQKVFESNTLANSWNGKSQSANAAQGVYIYLITAICPENGRRILKSGDVTLVR